MPQAVLGGFLVVHGLITTMIGAGAVTNPNSPAMTLPSWFSWWPGAFGRSWLFDALGLGTGVSVVGGLVWLVAGVALVAAGLGWLGVPGVRDLWQTLAFVGAALGLLALAVYFHPLYLVAVVIDLAVVVLLWGRLTTATS
jgi:hypothetical protein